MGTSASHGVTEYISESQPHVIVQGHGGGERAQDLTNRELLVTRENVFDGGLSRLAIVACRIEDSSYRIADWKGMELISDVNYGHMCYLSLHSAAPARSPKSFSIASPGRSYQQMGTSGKANLVAAAGLEDGTGECSEEVMRELEQGWLVEPVLHPGRHGPQAQSQETS